MRDPSYLLGLCASLVTLGVLLVAKPLKKRSQAVLQTNSSETSAPESSPSAAPVFQEPPESQDDEPNDIDDSSDSKFSFTFNAFGDSGWARTHTVNPAYEQGFKKSYYRFDPKQKLLADLNYLNWETSIGNHCKEFWSLPTPNAFAFLTVPEELSDAVSLGFNVIGLANNHSHDCTRTKEGDGIVESAKHARNIKFAAKSQNNSILMNGISENPNHEPAAADMTFAEGRVPVKLLSAYVGGKNSRCDKISCDINLNKHAESMSGHKGLRILALHSWDEASHLKLKSIMRQWIANDWADVALGTGPHVAETVELVSTPKGTRVIATSLGNFIHPSLKPQKNNIVLRTKWQFDPDDDSLVLQWLKTTEISCAFENCRRIKTRKHDLPPDLEAAAL